MNGLWLPPKGNTVCDSEYSVGLPTARLHSGSHGLRSAVVRFMALPQASLKNNIFGEKTGAFDASSENPSGHSLTFCGHRSGGAQTCCPKSPGTNTIDNGVDSVPWRRDCINGLSIVSFGVGGPKM